VRRVAPAPSGAPTDQTAGGQTTSVPAAVSAPVAPEEIGVAAIDPPEEATHPETNHDSTDVIDDAADRVADHVDTGEEVVDTAEVATISDADADADADAITSGAVASPHRQTATASPH